MPGSWRSTLTLTVTMLAVFQLGDRRRGAAVDEAGRQVPQQIDDERPGGALDQPAELRPDAGQRGHRGEKPVEEGRAQVPGYPPFARAG